MAGMGFGFSQSLVYQPRGGFRPQAALHECSCGYGLLPLRTILFLAMAHVSHKEQTSGYGKKVYCRHKYWYPWLRSHD